MMKYSLNEDKQKLSEQIEQVDKKIEQFIQEQKDNDLLFQKKVMQYLQELREEIVSVGKKSDEDRRASRKRRVKAIEQFKSE